MVTEDEYLQEMISFSLFWNCVLNLPSHNLNMKNIMILHMLMKQHIKYTKHKSMVHFAYTSDIWYSKYMMAFMALTIHFLTENFNMMSFTLEVEQIEGKHTGDFIKIVWRKHLTDGN